MRKSILFVACAATLLFTSCACIKTPNGIGAVYTNVVSTEQVSSNTLGSKVGSATSTNILGIVAIGDASVELAAKAAGIEKISHVDSKKVGFLGLFNQYTVYVYGE